MKWISIFIVSLLLTACGCRYNGINNREVLISSAPDQISFEPNDDSIDVTAEQITYTR